MVFFEYVSKDSWHLVTAIGILEPVRVGWRIHSLGLLRRSTGLRVGQAGWVVSLEGGFGTSWVWLQRFAVFDDGVVG